MFKALLLLDREIREMNGSELDDGGRIRDDNGLLDPEEELSSRSSLTLY